MAPWGLQRSRHRSVDRTETPEDPDRIFPATSAAKDAGLATAAAAGAVQVDHRHPQETVLFWTMRVRRFSMPQGRPRDRGPSCSATMDVIRSSGQSGRVRGPERADGPSPFRSLRDFEATSSACRPDRGSWRVGQGGRCLRARLHHLSGRTAHRLRQDQGRPPKHHPAAPQARRLRVEGTRCAGHARPPRRSRQPPLARLPGPTLSSPRLIAASHRTPSRRHDRGLPLWTNAVMLISVSHPHAYAPTSPYPVSLSAFCVLPPTFCPGGGCVRIEGRRPRALHR